MVSPKPWPVESVVRLFVRLLVCFAAGTLSMSALRLVLGEKAVADSMLNLFVSVITMQGGVLLVIALFLREQSASWTQAFGFKNETGWAIVLGICAAVIVLPAMWLLQKFSMDALAQLGFDVKEQEAVRLLRDAHGLGRQAILGVMAVVLAPVAEETFFRGILYPLAKQNSSRGFALVGVSIFFALIHCNLAIILPLTFLAVVLALLYEWTNNLLACILVHSLFNAANFVMLFVLKNSGQSPGSP